MVGYNIAVTEPTDGTLAQIDLKISRSPTAIAFVCFVTSMMWLLALGAIAVAFSVAVRGRKVEIGMFSWLAALLFALVPLRNAMPGSPPIGVLSDFAAFFWAEELVALSLVTVVFTWLRRPGVKA
jgi:hypothetical protein